MRLLPDPDMLTELSKVGVDWSRGGQIVWRDIWFDLFDLNLNVFDLIDIWFDQKTWQAYLNTIWFEGKNAWTYFSDIWLDITKKYCYLIAIWFDI